MPVVYETPQPLNTDVSTAYGATTQSNIDAPRLDRQREFSANLAEQRRQFDTTTADRRAAAAASGAGTGYGQGGIQDAINQRDSNAMRADQFNASIAAQRDGQQFQQAAEAQNLKSKYQLQSELQGVELTQQETIRYQRMKNAIGEVSADPSLADDEKADLILQLKTGIDPFENRLKKQRAAQEELVKQSLVEQHQFQTMQRQNALRIQGQTAEERTSFVPDPVALSEIAADLRANLPPDLPWVNESTIAEMAKQEAIKQGLGHHVYINPDGTIHSLSGEKTANAKSAAAAATGKGDDHPLGITPQDYNKERDRIESAIDKQATLTREDDKGFKQPLYPNLQTEEGRDAAIAKKLKDAGLPATLKEFNDMRTKRDKGSSASGYRSIFKKPEPVAAVATPMPNNWFTRLGQRAAESEVTPEAVTKNAAGELDNTLNRVVNGTGITDDDKRAATLLIQRAKEVAAKQPNPKKRSQEDKDEIDRLGAQLDTILVRVKDPVPPAPSNGMVNVPGDWVNGPSGRVFVPGGPAVQPNAPHKIGARPVARERQVLSSGTVLNPDGTVNPPPEAPKPARPGSVSPGPDGRPVYAQ